VKSLRAAYFDCYSGISGDMILGALIDLGVDPRKIRNALKTLDLKGYKLVTSEVKRGLIAGTKFISLEVHADFSRIHPQINQGAQNHVTANAGITIKISGAEGFHNILFFKGGFKQILNGFFTVSI
jgi:uncharacterized protein (DUF111 family)